MLTAVYAFWIGSAYGLVPLVIRQSVKLFWKDAGASAAQFDQKEIC